MLSLLKAVTRLVSRCAKCTGGSSSTAPFSIHVPRNPPEDNVISQDFRMGAGQQILAPEISKFRMDKRGSTPGNFFRHQHRTEYSTYMQLYPIPSPSKPAVRRGICITGAYATQAVKSGSSNSLVGSQHPLTASTLPPAVDIRVHLRLCRAKIPHGICLHTRCHDNNGRRWRCPNGLTATCNMNPANPPQI